MIETGIALKLRAAADEADKYFEYLDGIVTKQAERIAELEAQLAAPAAPVLTDLDRSIAGDAQAFEARLGREPDRVPDSSYPWGWRYASMETQRQFRAFILASMQVAAPQGEAN